MCNSFFSLLRIVILICNYPSLSPAFIGIYPAMYLHLKINSHHVYRILKWKCFKIHITAMTSSYSFRNNKTYLTTTLTLTMFSQQFSFNACVVHYKIFVLNSVFPCQSRVDLTYCHNLVISLKKYFFSIKYYLLFLYYDILEKLLISIENIVLLKVTIYFNLEKLCTTHLHIYTKKSTLKFIENLKEKLTKGKNEIPSFE